MAQPFQNLSAMKSGPVDVKPVRFIRLPEVREITGLSRSQIYRLEADPAGHFPKRIKLGTGPTSATAWVEAEITSWCCNRIFASRGAA